MSNKLLMINELYLDNYRAFENEPEALESFLQEEAAMFPTAYKQIIDKTIGA